MPEQEATSVESSPWWIEAPRDVILVEGPDARVFLHSQLANDIAALAVGASIHSLVLQPTGHLCCVARVCCHDETVFSLDVDAGHGEALIERLGRYVLRAKVTLHVSDWCCRTVVGAGRPAATEGEWSGVVAPSWWGDDPAVVDVVGPPSLDPAGGATEFDHDRWDRMRVDARWPRLGVDIVVGDVPATTGVVGVAVSFSKGCYPGQELVERMDSRGVGAPVEVRSLPAGGRHPGDEICDEGSSRSVATVTSVGDRWCLARVARGSTLGQPLTVR